MASHRKYFPAAGLDWALPIYDPLGKLLGGDAIWSAFGVEYKDLLFRSARLTLALSGESTIPITKKDNPGRGSSQEQEIYHERGRLGEPDEHKCA